MVDQSKKKTRLDWRLLLPPLVGQIPQIPIFNNQHTHSNQKQNPTRLYTNLGGPLPHTHLEKLLLGRLKIFIFVVFFIIVINSFPFNLILLLICLCFPCFLTSISIHPLLLLLSLKGPQFVSRIIWIQFLYPIFILFSSPLFTYFLHLLHYFTRFTCNDGSSKGGVKKIELIETMEQKQEKTDFLKFSSQKNEPPEVPFTFKFPTFEEYSKNQSNISEYRALEDSVVDMNDGGFESDEYKVVDFQKGSFLVFDDDQSKDEECFSELDGLNVNKIGADNTFSEDKYDESGSKEDIHDESAYNNPNSATSDLQAEDGFLSDGDFEVKFDEKQGTNFLSEKDFVTNENEKKSSNDTTNKLESLWEHQELIEQLKMEIKKVKAIGLPTIFEESESPPKIMEELKPWKIEEVYQSSSGNMGEVHKFYKSYRERMRKFDIFNYQKMYAIGFLQLKDPLWSSSSSKSSVPEFTTLLNQSFSTNKGKKNEEDPTMKFIKELQSDLEVVYVGQMCMSWEILHWQYEKALDIWDSDPHGVRRFNEIADEFQQFQVLMQRFIEDEPFQGPRIQHYVKSRCVFRNLLQVPVIRADDYKKVRHEEVVYDITSDLLVEILEESIRIFWRFVRADKYKKQTPVEFQKPEDLQLFMELQKDLHKKERKLKEQLRGGNCILKKFRSCREDEEIDDQVLYFFCQVDMKLVSRVLQMTRITTDQLVWCHNKLNKVSFVNRKIHVEPSFLLFPC